jgi:hypothetical protein
MLFKVQQVSGVNRHGGCASQRHRPYDTVVLRYVTVGHCCDVLCCCVVLLHDTVLLR